MERKKKYQVLMHLVVLIFGFTGILGALIQLPAPQLVWYRMGIAVLGIGGYILYREALGGFRTKGVPRLIGVGFIIALHWIAFFAAIKASNVSVTLACMASATLFTAFLEPLFFKKKIHWYEVFLGILVITGLVTIFRFETEYVLGITYALLAAFSAALFTVLNAGLVKGTDHSRISFYEMLGGVIGISLYLGITGKWEVEMFRLPSLEWLYIVILGLICTAFAFMSSVMVMKELTPFTVALTINMEPIYGIVLAFLIFGESEEMTLGFYVGTLLILLALFLDAFIKARERRKKNLRNKIS